MSYLVCAIVFQARCVSTLYGKSQINEVARKVTELHTFTNSTKGMEGYVNHNEIEIAQPTTPMEVVT